MATNSQNISAAYEVTPKIQIKTLDNILIKEFTNLIFEKYTSSYDNKNSPFFFILKTSIEGLVKMKSPGVISLPGDNVVYSWNNPNNGDAGKFVFLQNLPLPEVEEP